MKKIILSIILISIFFINISGQNKSPGLDTVLITDICIENVCFGDSIKKLIKFFGTPKDVWYAPPEDGEFAEPAHNMYWYQHSIFYEILYPNLSDSLLYGCRLSINKTSVTIKGIKMTIGKTTINDIAPHFKYSMANVIVTTATKEYYITFDIILPDILNEVRGAFISRISLYFSNDKILRNVETRFDLN